MAKKNTFNIKIVCGSEVIAVVSFGHDAYACAETLSRLYIDAYCCFNGYRYIFCKGSYVGKVKE